MEMPNITRDAACGMYSLIWDIFYTNFSVNFFLENQALLQVGAFKSIQNSISGFLSTYFHYQYHIHLDSGANERISVKGKTY